MAGKRIPPIPITKALWPGLNLLGRGMKSCWPPKLAISLFSLNSLSRCCSLISVNTNVLILKDPELLSHL